jgi:hypothetical protein
MTYKPQQIVEDLKSFVARYLYSGDLKLQAIDYVTPSAFKQRFIFHWDDPKGTMTCSAYLPTHINITKDSNPCDLLELYSRSALSLGILPKMISIHSLGGKFKDKFRYRAKIKVAVCKEDVEAKYTVPYNSICTLDAIARKPWYELTDIDLVKLYRGST